MGAAAASPAPVLCPRSQPQLPSSAFFQAEVVFLDLLGRASSAVTF